MMQINLLPWREQARKEEQTRFGIQIGIFVGISLVIVLFIHLFLSGVINQQQARNTYLQAELNRKQTELTLLQQKKADEIILQSRLHFLLNMRTKSYSAVRILSELNKIVPEKITLNLVQRKGNLITIQGEAKSDLDITQFMKNISQVAIFNQPVLTEISTKESIGEEKYFQLKVTLQGTTIPNAKT